MLNPDDIPDANVRGWYQQKSNGRKRIDPPTILQLEVTKNCNFACLMCHKGQAVASGRDFVRDDLSDIALEQVRPVFPFLRQAMLFGDGEPMVYRHFWRIVEEIRAASPRCMIDFINNGSMMHEKNIERCLDFNVSHIGLSIGGACATSHNFCRPPGQFDKIVHNYQMLRDAKQQANTLEPYVTALMVVMQANYKELENLVMLAKELNFFEVSLQKLFVTHQMVEDQVVDDVDLEPYLDKAVQVAKKLHVGFHHYPISSGKVYSAPPLVLKPDDLMFSRAYTRLENCGYCAAQQPWNTIYVLHDGSVVPDCHWWSSIHETTYNVCGKLNEQNNILDIWNGYIYTAIRERIASGKILPQCRGCGLAGGVISQFRSPETDHTNPDEERLIQLAVNIPPKFDILTTTLDDPEWFEVLIMSLRQTLKKSNRKILVIDDSLPENLEKIRAVNTQGLNVIIHHREEQCEVPLIYGLKLIKTPYVCICDSDIAMLRPDWDVYIERLLDKYSMIGSGVRYWYPETNFLIAKPEILLEAQFRHSGDIEWDENVLPKPVDTECATLMYFNRLHGGFHFQFKNQVPLDKRKWGQLVLDDQGNELLYHSFYGSRIKPTSKAPVPDIELALRPEYFERIESNALVIKTYLENKRGKLADFLKNFPTRMNDIKGDLS